MSRRTVQRGLGTVRQVLSPTSVYGLPSFGGDPSRSICPLHTTDGSITRHPQRVKNNALVDEPMASGYALPDARAAAGSQHGHSHSFSGIHLSPEKRTSHLLPTANGSPVKKAASNSALYTHAEASRETSPVSSPYAEQFPSFEQNAAAVEHNRHVHTHAHTRSWSPMKSRQRGDSDLGSPAYQTRGPAAAKTSLVASSSGFSLSEGLTALLVPLPYVLASATFSALSGLPGMDFPPLAAYEPRDSGQQLSLVLDERSSGVIETCTVTSGVLLAVGIIAEIQSAGRLLDRRKPQLYRSGGLSSLVSRSAIESMTLHTLAVGLPFYASMQLGGARVGLILLTSFAVGMTNLGKPAMPSFDTLKNLWSSQVATTAVFVLAFICDESGITINNSLFNEMLGYLALAISILVLPPPLPTAASQRSSRFNATSNHRSNSSESMASPLLTRSLGDANTTLAAGTLLVMLTGLAALLSGKFAIPSTSAIILSIITVATMALAITFSKPSSLRSQSKAGLALGCLTTASCSFLFSPSLWPGTVCNGGLSALSFLSVLYDTHSNETDIHHHDDHDHAHHVHTHTSQPKATEAKYSALTKFFMVHCEPGSLVHTILSEKDSRRIAYFTTLNFGFMIVQGVYGYISGSLGLLSDTVHMFFDCLGLVVGLGAAVASKWPTSPEKPYGWGKLNTLAGFGNGVFLMLVSVEFVWEAIEGILEKRELRHVQELLVVSTLGLLVNMVGLFAFGHAHAGHDHGHSHSHGSDHDHSHAHNHSHSNGHAHSHDCDHGHKHEHKAHGDRGGGHGHHNDNMHGIFLHVAADAGGSLAVIISTALTLWKPWYLWDPLATIIIAVLIFAAAVPLVTSSGQKLLLVIPEDQEYSIKTTLQGLGELRGVVGYAAPRFWLDDMEDADDANEHHHHGHDHGAHAGQQRLQGVIHVIAAPYADLEDVRERVEEYTMGRNMDLVIHVERDADQCWCNGGAGGPPSR